MQSAQPDLGPLPSLSSSASCARPSIVVVGGGRSSPALSSRVPSWRLSKTWKHREHATEDHEVAIAAWGRCLIASACIIRSAKTRLRQQSRAASQGHGASAQLKKYVKAFEISGINLTRRKLRRERNWPKLAFSLAACLDERGVEYGFLSLAGSVVKCRTQGITEDSLRDLVVEHDGDSKGMIVFDSREGFGIFKNDLRDAFAQMPFPSPALSALEMGIANRVTPESRDDSSSSSSSQGAEQHASPAAAIRLEAASGKAGLKNFKKKLESQGLSHCLVATSINDELTTEQGWHSSSSGLLRVSVADLLSTKQDRPGWKSLMLFSSLREAATFFGTIDKNTYQIHSAALLPVTLQAIQAGNSPLPRTSVKDDRPPAADEHVSVSSGPATTQAPAPSSRPPAVKAARSTEVRDDVRDVVQEDTFSRWRAQRLKALEEEGGDDNDDEEGEEEENGKIQLLHRSSKSSFDMPLCIAEHDLLLDLFRGVPELRIALEQHPEFHHITNIILDEGRRPRVLFSQGASIGAAELQIPELTQHEIKKVARTVDFNAQGRAIIPNTLHRVSCIKVQGRGVIGLTVRCARHVPGCMDPLKDVLGSGSLLLLGPPGRGKTTLLREAAKLESSDPSTSTIIVDKSDEIAGSTSVHESVGPYARRLPVPYGKNQSAMMLEAVENHTAKVVIVDEISNIAESRAASTISARGVRLIATCHGESLLDLMSNEELDGLVGGMESVILASGEARYNGKKKVVKERKGRPVFKTIVELHSQSRFVIIRGDMEEIIDDLLAKGDPEVEVREVDDEGNVWSKICLYEEARHLAKHGILAGEDDEM